MSAGSSGDAARQREATPNSNAAPRPLLAAAMKVWLAVPGPTVTMISVLTQGQHMHTISMSPQKRIPPPYFAKTAE